MKQIGFYLLTLLAVVSSCVDNDFSAGSSLLTGNVRNVIVDTCTVNLKTVLADSSATSGIGKVFIGRYESSDFGVLSADAYVSFSKPSYSSTEFSKDSKVKIHLDSVCLLLKYDGFSYGDTTKAQTIEITRLTGRLDNLYDKHGTFYNNQTVAAESTPYLSKTFYRPRQGDENDSTLSIRFPQAFGQQIIDSLKAQSAIFDSDANFMEFFKGFKFSAGKDDKYCINAFKTSSGSLPVIRLYYHSISDVAVEKTLDLTANSTYPFSHIVQDRSTTLLKDLTSSKGLLSTKTANKAYVQGLVGLSTELTFPYIYSLLQYGKYTKVSAAYLYIYPIEDTYNDFTPLPKSAKLNFVNKLGDVKDILVSNSSLSAGTLAEDQITIERFYYPFDVTSFIQSEITALEVDKGTLQFQLSDADKPKTLKSIVIGDSSYPIEKYRIKLVIQLLVYDND